jgi:thioesterase domain-containing protein/acyl carrier protein
VAELSVAEDRKTPGDIESRMIRLWRSLLGRPDIDAVDDFFDLGGHSLLAARLIAGISKEFGTTLDFATLFHAPTVRALAELVGGEKNVAADSPVLPVQPEGRLAPVFGIDHTWIYDHLASQLGPERPFFAVQTRYSSMDGTERSLQHIAAEQVRSIRRQQPRGPYVLLGLCAAGVLAFEIAQQLQDQGEDVPLLIMIDTWSPGYLARQSPAKRKLADLSYRWQILLSDFRRGAERGMLSMLTFGLARLRGYAVKRMRGALPKRAAMQESGEELDPIVLLRAATRSATQRPFTGRICLFHRDTMPSGRFLDPQLGWGDFAAGVIETHRLPGDHFSMFRDPGVTKMAEIINRALQAEQV